MENKCAALCCAHWNIHQHGQVVHQVLFLSFGRVALVRGSVASSQQQLECFCASERGKTGKQPDLVTAHRPGGRSVRSVNRSSATQRPHEPPRLLTSRSTGKQYCDNGAAAAGSHAELSIWRSGNRSGDCARFGPAADVQPQLSVKYATFDSHACLSLSLMCPHWIWMAK